jgi:hypothetical protein
MRDGPLVGRAFCFDARPREPCLDIRAVEQIDFEGMDETDFEEFCFDLVDELGFVNRDWRKGTPLKSSPAYRKGVPAEKLQGLLSWAHA